jgi:hypothetical protein
LESRFDLGQYHHLSHRCLSVWSRLHDPNVRRGGREGETKPAFGGRDGTRGGYARLRSGTLADWRGSQVSFSAYVGCGLVKRGYRDSPFNRAPGATSEIQS